MSKEKGILVITQLFMPVKGGTAVWFDEVYRRLGGKEIHIVTQKTEGSEEHDVDHANTIHRLRLKRYWWLKPESLLMYMKFFWQSFFICLTNKITEVHAGRVLPEGLIAVWIAKMFRKPSIIYAHGEEITTWRTPGKRRAMRYAYQQATHVIANSQFTRQQLIDLGVNPANITIIYPGVNLERFHKMQLDADFTSRHGIGDKQKIILSVGRLSRRKGFDHLIKACSTLKDIDYVYALIGIGEDREYLEQLAINNGIHDKVKFLGHVSTDDLPRWYNAADVVAMPNREIDGDTEGFGMVFIEAAACGKPSIAGNAGGTGDAVIDGETGFRVDGNNVAEIADRLQRLLQDEALAASMSEKGFARATTEFGWAAVAEKTQLLQAKLL